MSASAEEPQYELLRRLQDQGILTREIAQLFGEVRRAGNAAIGDPLIPHGQRVDGALQRLKPPAPGPRRSASGSGGSIAAQTKANLIVDRDAFDDPDVIFKREGGGFIRLDRIFGGELTQVLDAFNEAVWEAGAA